VRGAKYILTVYRDGVIIGLVVVLVLVLGLPTAALVIAPRLRPAKPHPRMGTADRAYHLARGVSRRTDATMGGERRGRVGVCRRRPAMRGDLM